MAVAEAWLWVAFGLAIAVLAAGAVCLEACKKGEASRDTLRNTHPTHVLLHIVVFQAAFYGLLFVAVFTADVAADQPFWLTQMFDAGEYVLSDARGRTTGLALVVAFSAMFLPIAFVSQRHTRVPDYLLTLAILHVVVVAVYMGAFPAHGGFWLAMCVGLVVGGSLADWLTYRLYLLDIRTLAEGNGGSDDFRTSFFGRSRSDTDPGVLGGGSGAGGGGGGAAGTGGSGGSLAGSAVGGDGTLRDLARSLQRQSSDRSFGVPSTAAGTDLGDGGGGVVVVSTDAQPRRRPLTPDLFTPPPAGGGTGEDPGVRLRSGSQARGHAAAEHHHHLTSTELSLSSSAMVATHSPAWSSAGVVTYPSVDSSYSDSIASSSLLGGSVSPCAPHLSHSAYARVAAGDHDGLSSISTASHDQSGLLSPPR